MEQHNDHIWMTINGENWAIRKIDRKYGLVIHFWRGYEPNLQFVSYEFRNSDWEGYCNAAFEMLYSTRSPAT